MNSSELSVHVDGYFTNMKGTLPQELRLLTGMQYFEIQHCGKDLRGDISDIGTDWTNLTAFAVNYNKLSGVFPFVNNSLLGTILMNGNDIEGDIGSISNLSSLSWFEAEGNKFAGSLPDAITKMEYLCKMDLSLIKGHMYLIWNAFLTNI
jgi:Leucine-rich repeat (LRR) protein